MVNYIIKIVQKMAHQGDSQQTLSEYEHEVNRLVLVLAEELDRLDPRDFLPDGQFDFVYLRSKVRDKVKDVLKGFSGVPVVQLADHLLDVLNKYAGEGSRAETREFPFIHDGKLRQIVERDYSLVSTDSFMVRASLSPPAASQQPLENSRQIHQE